MALLPDAVKVILGGLLNSEELLMLPSEWKGLKQWEIYMGILKNKFLDDRLGGSESQGRWFEYVKQVDGGLESGQ